MAGAEHITTAAEVFMLQAELLLKYNLDVAKRTFWIMGEINTKTLKHVDACLSILETQGRQKVTIKLCSEGGEVDEALAIVSRMQRSPCKVRVEAHGQCMSAATAILAIGSKRSVSKYVTFMFHEASYGIEGKHSEIKPWIAQFDKSEATWAALMAEHSNKDASFWLEQSKHTDKFLTPAQLLEYGVVDEIF